jgi:hypothetical protein
MLDIKLHRRLSTTIIGFLIFFVPFFTYLSPENLKQLSQSDVFEILLSLIIILIIILISSFSLEILIKQFFRKRIILFPLLCFAFYLNFLYLPFSESVKEFLYPKFDFIGTPLFIFFELCCLAIIAFGAKFNIFAIRMILIFSIFMLINAFIPLVSYLTENIGKNTSISYEIKSSTLAQDKILTKRNIYYIIIDGMMAINTADQINIATRKEVLDNLSNVGLKYIDKSKSSYTTTYMTLSSIMFIDYHQKPSSPKYIDRANFYPAIMYADDTKLPLISYLKKANSSFFWSGNYWGRCKPSGKWSCINSRNDFFSRHSGKFYNTTPFPKMYLNIFEYNESTEMQDTQDTIDSFLKYIDKKGAPKTPFFAFIHHLRPHTPFTVTDECEPTNYFNRNFEGYKASYQCVLKQVKMFMEKINDIDPEAIVVFQADHGWNMLDLELTEKEKYQYRGKIFNAIKAPETCFEKYGLPKTNVNTIRFTLNCAYGFQLPYRKNIHYESYNEDEPDYGTVVERQIYE